MAKDGDSDGGAISQSIGGRSNLEKTVGGGSWTEYFDKGTSAALNRTKAIDGKLQLETDITSLIKWTGNPVLPGSVGKFDSNGIRMNSVLFDNGTFKMWYSGYDGANWRTGYATSMDGINWTKQNSGNPVLNLGAANTWDDGMVMVGSVIKDGDTYRMWYSGNDEANSQTGYATSSDGISWVKNAGNPVIKKTANTCYTNHIGPSTIIKEGNTYKGWFTCNNGNGNAGSRITYGTSNNGVAWAVNANAIFGVGKNGAFDSTGVHGSHVWKEGDRYYMTYGGWNGVKFAIGAAESFDGKAWKRMNNGNPVLANGGVGSYDSDYMVETSVVNLGYQKYIWYGAMGAAYGISLAKGTSYYTEGYVFSEKIDLPNGMSWDTLSLKKIEPTGTSVKISVADPTTNKPITNFDNLTSSDINISSIDSVSHKSIRLIAYLKGTSTLTPTLLMWGVSWHEVNTWRDTFIGSSKIESYNVKNLRLWNDKIRIDADPLNWTKDDQNPIITKGGTGKFDENGGASPSFLAFNGKNYLFYNGVNTGADKIGFARGTDLSTFTKNASNPVISPTVGTFDVNSTRDPDVQFTDNYLKMYYAGKGPSTGVGLAVGVDQTTWMKYEKDPVFIPSGALWDNGQIRDPNVIRDNNTWSMYYSGNTSGGGWAIGLAKSYDNGFTWVRPSNNKVLDVGQSGNFDDQSVRSPSVIYDKDRYLMFYVGNDTATGTGRIGFASSTDGITWTRENGGGPIVSTGIGWESVGPKSLTVGVVNGRYELYYEADAGDGAMRIGHATSNTYTSGTVVSKEIDVPPNGLWNGVLVNKTEPSGTHINVTVLDASTGTPVSGFTELTAGSINISTINANITPKLMLKATFDSNGLSTPALNDWAINWTIAKVVQKTQIPDKSLLEEGTATNLYNLSQYFTHKRFTNTSLNYTISSDTDPVNIVAKIETDGLHMSFSAPTVNWTGSSKYTIKVSDGYNNMTSNQFTVTVLNVNDRPIWMAIPDKHITEDTPVNNLVDLTKYVVDCDSALKDLVFTIFNTDPANMTVNLNANNQADVTPVSNYTGTVKVLANVSDGQYQVNTSFNIIVDPINDAPVWTHFGPLQIVEDTPLVDIMNLETMIKDAETSSSDLVYTVSSDPNKVVATISSAHMLNLYPAVNYTGTMNLTFNVSDGQYMVPLKVMVIVTPVNDAPLWLTVPQFTFPEDTKDGQNLVNLEPYVVDSETLSKNLVYNVEDVSEPTASVMIDSSHQLNVVPDENYFGTIIIEVSASDGLLISMTNITVIVTPVNDPPIITSTPLTSVVATERYQYQVTAMDVENDHLTYSLTSLISGMTIEASTGLLKWIPTESQTGSYVVKIQVSDGLATAIQDYFIDVSPKPNPTNNPPVITSQPPTEVLVGDMYTYTVVATDADNDPLTYSLPTRPTGMNIKSTTGVVDWTPQAGMEGDHPVVVAVSDGKVQVTQSFVITVYKNGTIINHPPIITSKPMTKTLVGSEYSYKVVATDLDRDMLHYYLTLAPENMTIDALTGQIKWSPDAKNIGDNRILIRVSDGKANESQDYLLQVSNVNHMPSVTSTPITEATVGKQYTYQLVATDLDTGDKLLFGLRSGPVGMSLDPTTGLLTWTPTKKGTQTVTVYVSDGNFQTNQTFDIKVTAKKTSGSNNLANFPWWILVVIIIVIVVILTVVLSQRREKKEEPHAAPPSAHKPHPIAHQRTSSQKKPAPPVEKAPGPAPTAVKVEAVMDIDDLEDEPKDTEAETPSKEKPTKPKGDKPKSEGAPSKKEESTNDVLDEILGKVPEKDADSPKGKLSK